MNEQCECSTQPHVFMLMKELLTPQASYLTNQLHLGESKDGFFLFIASHKQCPDTLIF